MDQKFINLINKINISWRPITVIIFIISLTILYILYPIVYMIVSYFGKTVTIPEMVYNHVDGLISGLGILAGLRTWEKIKNATNNH